MSREEEIHSVLSIWAHPHIPQILDQVLYKFAIISRRLLSQRLAR